MKTWSHSALSLYEKCPQAYKLHHINKHKPPEIEALTRGTALHLQIEDYLQNKTQEQPECIHLNADYYARLKEKSPIVEQEWGFDINWQPTTWLSNNIWCRMKIDAYFIDDILHIIDHKSGKVRPIKAIDQGQLYAIGASLLFPYVTNFQCDFVYIDQGEVHSTKYTRSQLEKLKPRIQRRVDKLMIDEIYSPKPNKFGCKYCGVKDFCQFNAEEST